MRTSTAPKAGVFERLEDVLETCIDNLCSKPEILCKNPAKDFTRNRKITPQTLLRFYIAIDGKCLKKATCDFMHQQGKENATYQAFSLQKAKLTQEAFPYLFKTFNEASRHYDTRTYQKGYSLIACLCRPNLSPCYRTCLSQFCRPQCHLWGVQTGNQPD